MPLADLDELGGLIGRFGDRRAVQGYQRGVGVDPGHRPSAPGRFHVSAANFWPRTRDGLHFPERLEILDSTLRKASFTAGNTTSLAGFVRIAEALVELGVTETCLNVTWSGDPDPTPQDWALMTTILGAGLPLRVNVWSDVLLGNGRDPLPIDPLDGLRRLVDAGADRIAPGIVPAPDPEAARRQLDDLDAHLELARELGVTTTITLAQVGLRSFDDLVHVARHAALGGAARLDLMDSTSSMSPDAMRQFVRRFRSEMPDGTQVTMHAHHEFGLSTASALAAASEGAAPDVSVNGMSYRAGFAPLEEVVLALEVLYGVDTGLDLNRLAHVSRVVAKESGLAVPPMKALTGGYAHLKHMPGDAAAAILLGDAAFPPISHGIVPSVMGSRIEWVWGCASSTAQARALAASLGLALTDAEVREARRAIDAAVAVVPDYPRWLLPEEAAAVMRRCVEDMRSGRVRPALGDVVSQAVADPGLASDVVAGLGGNAYVPVPGADAVERAVACAVDGLSTGALIDLLAQFRRFGEEDGGARPGLSDQEERALASSEAAARSALAEAARAYEVRFGFRAVVAAEGRTASELADVVRSALDSDAVTELARTRRAVTQILSGRIDRLAAPDVTRTKPSTGIPGS